MKHTEAESEYKHLEKLSSLELITGILNENRKVITAIEQVIPVIEKVIEHCFLRIKEGGRLFYLGAGTSGRLGIVDASECLPTFGLDNVIIGIIAGGDSAIRKAVEFAEDDTEQGWKDVKMYHITEKDCLLGISASGRTPYVLSALKTAKEHHIYTAGLVCNADSPISQVAQDTIEVLTGAEFITGSTRMKAGTAQKIVLNMISTAIMIKLGRVQGNKMIHMQLTNQKLIERGTNMLTELLHLPYEEAKALLMKYGSVKKVLDEYAK